MKKNTLTELKAQERDTRKEIIINAAQRVFAIKPFDKVSVREIADEAGIGTSTIYTYFPNQEALFVETALRDANVLIEELDNVIGNNSVSDVEHVIESFIDFISQNDSYFRMMVVFMTQGNLTEESLSKLNSTMRLALDMFDEIFMNLGYSGNIRILSRFFFSALNGILVTFRKLPGRNDEDVISHMKDLGKVFGKLLIQMEGKEL